MAKISAMEQKALMAKSWLRAKIFALEQNALKILDPIYEPLNEDERNFEFRLLEILDVTGDSRISCRLSKATFTDEPSKIPSYTALSYVWGNVNSTERITLNGRPWLVTKNLASALRHIGKHWQTAISDEASPGLFWIDALCINQRDLEERARQVSKMQYIYNSADAVFAWLGGEDEDEMISRAMDSIELLANASMYLNTTQDDILTFDWMRRYPDLCRDDTSGGDNKHNSNWASLTKIFELPYWSRVWIFQEVIMAHQLYFVCPSRVLHWVSFKKTNSLMSRTHELISQCFVSKPEFIDYSCWWPLTRPIINWEPIKTIDNAKRDWEESMLYRQLDNPRQILWAIEISSFSAHLKASDPKDHIYGLLGLTKMSIEPDYQLQKSYVDVYCEYVSYCLSIYPQEASSTFDELWFLRLAGALYSTEGSDFPSWAPNYAAQKPVVPENIALDVSSFADANVFDPPLKKSRPIIEQRSLRTVGLRVQRVRSLGANIGGSDTQNQLREYSIGFCLRHKAGVLGVSPLQALYRVFMRVPNLDEDCATPAEILGFLLYLCPDASIDTAYFVHDFFPELGWETSEPFDYWVLRTFLPESPEDFPFFERLGGFENPFSSEEFIHHGFNEMKLGQSGAYYFETDDDECFGMAPRGTMPGDTVAILKGYSAPVIIRKIESHYIFIGTCFVLGYMNGEARALIEKGRERAEVFEFR